jgi:hypothetical protein
MTGQQREEYRQAREWIADHPEAGDAEVAAAIGADLSRPGTHGIIAAAREAAGDGWHEQDGVVEWPAWPGAWTSA